MQKLELSDVVKYCTITIAALYLIIKGINPGFQENPADFNNYYVASKLVVEGKPMHQFYDNNWFKNEAKNMGIESGAKFAPFPPVTAYVFVPLTYFSPIQAKRIWTIFNCLLVILIGLRAKKYLNTTFSNAFLFVFIFTIPIANCINFGQIYLLMAYFLTWAIISSASKTRFILVGILLGIAALIKYLPLLFLPYFYKHYHNKKIWLITALTILATSVTIYLIDPLVYESFSNTFASHLNGNLSGQGKYAVGFQSIDSLLNNLFVYDNLLNPTPFVDAAILKSILKIVLVLAIGIILFVLLKKSNYKLNPVLISIGIVGSFIIFPATASYHFLLLFLPVLFINKWLLAFSKQHIIFLIAVIATFTIQYHHIPTLDSLPNLNLILHYPRFWCLLFVFLFLSFNYLKLNTSKHG